MTNEMIFFIIMGSVFFTLFIIVISIIVYRKYLNSTSKYPVKEECNHVWGYANGAIIKQQRIRKCKKCDLLQDKIVMNNGTVIKDWEDWETEIK